MDSAARSPWYDRASRYTKAPRLVAEVAAARLRPGKVRSVLFSPSQPEWIPALRRGCSAAGYRASFEPLSSDLISAHDLVVPLTIPELRDLANHPELICENPIPVPDHAAISQCDDKREFAEALISGGFGDFVPDESKISKAARFPYILKKAVDAGSANCHLIGDRVQEHKVSSLLNSPDYLVQAYIPGEKEYATHLVFRDRRVVCSLEIEYVFATQTPIKFQNKHLYTRMRECPHLDTFSLILEGIGFEGLCCVNYKYQDGRPRILEVNPRMGGSLGRFFFSFLRHL